MTRRAHLKRPPRYPREPGPYYQPTDLRSARRALAALRDQTVDLLLTDLAMPSLEWRLLHAQAALPLDLDMAGIVSDRPWTLGQRVRSGHAGRRGRLHPQALPPQRHSSRCFRLLLPAWRVCKENRRTAPGSGDGRAQGKAISHALDFDTVLRNVVDTALAQNLKCPCRVSLCWLREKDEPGVIRRCRPRRENLGKNPGECASGSARDSARWLSAVREPDQRSAGDEAHSRRAASRYSRQCLHRQ